MSVPLLPLPFSETEVRLPCPSDPIVAAKQAPSLGDPIPLFGDQVWPVRFFSANPSTANVRVHWPTFTTEHVEHFRLAAWALFNLPFDGEALRLQAPSMRASLSALRISHTINNWRMLGRWLRARGIPSVSSLDTDIMGDYAEHLRSERKVARNTAVNHLTAITRLWVIGEEVPELRLAGIPPWVTHDLNSCLPPGSGSGENTTHPIAPDAMGSLLHWAQQMTGTAAEHVLRVHRLHIEVCSAARRQRTGTHAQEKDQLGAYFTDLMAEGAPVPTKLHSNRVAFDNEYIAHVTGVSLDAVYRWTRKPETRRYAETHHATVLVDLDHDRRTGGLLPDTIEITAIPALVGLLRAAAFVVIAYLTGMRPGEVLALRAGSLTPSNQDGGWMLLRSRTFKGARDAEGNHDSNGIERDAPWVAVAPVVTAIRVLETLHSNGLLFPSPHYIRNETRSISHAAAADRVVRFIDWINRRQPNSIPEDPKGRVTPMRFRRTLAWHIANQPGGLIALAVQYGHLRTAISEGYASRSRDGLQDLIDFETARTIARRLSDAHEAFENGEGVSGPSALRFVDSMREQAAQFNGLVTSERQARILLSNPHLIVFQNDDAYVWCNFDRDRALCLNGSTSQLSTPRLDRCRPTCANVARTDSQIDDLSYEVTRLRGEAALRLTPKPIADRLLTRAGLLGETVREHRRSRLTAEELNADQ